MQPIKIKENVYWVGGIDWDLRNFHGYLTHRGSTYNAYLVIDEKITLIDTVKPYLCDEMLERISKIVDPARIDYIVCNHVEMDHSGSIPQVLSVAKNAKIVTSPNGAKGLGEHFDLPTVPEVVKNGETLNTGNYTFSFYLTPMVHWPDNMVTYLAEEKILFSNDAFGQHLASSERFDDEYHLEIIVEEARKYYANIVLPYAEQVKKALASVDGLPIDIIAPSHGIIWKEHIQTIIDNYNQWSNNTSIKKALIIYDTMWNSTKVIAQEINNTFESIGYKTRLLNLQHNHISDIMTELIDAEYVCVGSPTLNNNMLPTVAAFLTYLKGLAPKNRNGLAFGSYGWGGQSIGLIENDLSSIGFNMLNSIKIKYKPSSEQLMEIHNMLIEGVNNANN